MNEEKPSWNLQTADWNLGAPAVIYCFEGPVLEDESSRLGAEEGLLSEILT